MATVASRAGRACPSGEAQLTAPVLGSLVAGDVVDVVEIAADGAGLWGRLARRGGGPPLWTLLAGGGGRGAPFLSPLPADGVDRALASLLLAGESPGRPSPLGRALGALAAHEALRRAERRLERVGRELLDRQRARLAAEALGERAKQAALARARAKRLRMRDRWDAVHTPVEVRRLRARAALEDGLRAAQGLCEERLRQLRAAAAAEVARVRHARLLRRATEGQHPLAAKAAGIAALLMAATPDAAAGGGTGSGGPAGDAQLAIALATIRRRQRRGRTRGACAREARAALPPSPAAAEPPGGPAPCRRRGEGSRRAAGGGVRGCRKHLMGRLSTTTTTTGRGKARAF
ncbi:unnamed protein product [Prorocentrum cordatum]|uniref:Uncharacterized protein n=1 Tax=Prorocentrum cordatum TaxID=2364126 RepID=A0ABN9PYK6_9DINO|nr:unnamed protein product [Polarella glacialis]